MAIRVIHRLVRWGNRYFNPDWRLVPFQHILFTMLFIGTIHVVQAPGDPIGFDAAFGVPWYYYVWLWLSFASPLLLWCATYLIRFRAGRERYRGYLFRFASSVGQFAATMSFAVAWVSSGRATGNDYRVYMMFILVSVLLFMIVLIVRDLWKVLLIEHLANIIHRGGDEDDDDGE